MSKDFADSNKPNFEDDRLHSLFGFRQIVLSPEQLEEEKRKADRLGLPDSLDILND
jgi:hypothetical protein